MVLLKSMLERDPDKRIGFPKLFKKFNIDTT